jgi:hypothetical protein
VAGALVGTEEAYGAFMPMVMCLDHWRRRLLWLAFFALCGGALACATTIGNRRNPAEVQLVIGKTLKAEVAEALGLPAAQRVTKGHEYWAYDDEPRLAELHLADVTMTSYSPPAASAQMRTYAVDEAAREAYVYVFDDSGTLVSILKNDD